MTAPPQFPTVVIETKRLILRLLTMDDLDALAELYADPEVRRYFPEGVLDYEQTREELDWFINEYYAKYGYGLWATIHKPTGRFIGRCGLLPWTIAGRFEVEVAYMLAKEFWGQGLATEAALACRDYGFNQLGRTRLICLVDPDNDASANVARKMGMTLEFEGDIENYPTKLFSMERPPVTAATDQ